MAALEEKKEECSTASEAPAAFSSTLMRGLRDGAPTANVVASPFSVLVALSMLVPGSAKKTRSALISALFGVRKGGDKKSLALVGQCQQLTAAHSREPVLRIANRIWVNARFELHSAYAKALGTLAVPLAADGAAAKTVNAWVDSNTRGEITQLVSADMFDADFRLCITNAIYFKGKFKTPFKATQTQSAIPFLTAIGGATKCRCRMMRSLGTVQLYKRSANFTFVALPYKGADITLILALPNSNHGKIPKCERVAAMKLKATKINLFVPKFKFESEFKLKATLSRMGLAVLFSESACDLSRMVASEELYVSAVVHKAMIEVDETGTVAAAATAVICKAKGKAMRKSKPIPKVRFDSPFAFFIVETKQKLVLFSGTVCEPK